LLPEFRDFFVGQRNFNVLVRGRNGTYVPEDVTVLVADLGQFCEIAKLRQRIGIKDDASHAFASGKSIDLGFYSCGAPPLVIWVDGLVMK
jgi:hypothetical protein